MVTKAMVGHLRSNLNVLDPLYPRQPFRGNWIFWTEGRPLRHPILDDHVSRQRVKRTLEVVCVLCIVFQLMFVFEHAFVSYGLILLLNKSCMHN